MVIGTYSIAFSIHLIESDAVMGDAGRTWKGQKLQGDLVSGRCDVDIYARKFEKVHGCRDKGG